jgi:hypothetical protein
MRSTLRSPRGGAREVYLTEVTCLCVCVCVCARARALVVRQVKPARVGESAINFECELVKTHDIVNAAGKVTATVLFGEVAHHNSPHSVSLPSPSSPHLRARLHASMCVCVSP